MTLDGEAARHRAVAADVEVVGRTLLKVADKVGRLGHVEDGVRRRQRVLRAVGIPRGVLTQLHDALRAVLHPVVGCAEAGVHIQSHRCAVAQRNRSPRAGLDAQVVNIRVARAIVARALHAEGDEATAALIAAQARVHLLPTVVGTVAQRIHRHKAAHVVAVGHHADNHIVIIHIVRVHIQPHLGMLHAVHIQVGQRHLAVRVGVVVVELHMFVVVHIRTAVIAAVIARPASGGTVVVVCAEVIAVGQRRTVAGLQRHRRRTGRRHRVAAQIERVGRRRTQARQVVGVRRHVHRRGGRIDGILRAVGVPHRVALALHEAVRSILNVVVHRLNTFYTGHNGIRAIDRQVGQHTGADDQTIHVYRFPAARVQHAEGQVTVSTLIGAQVHVHRLPAVVQTVMHSVYRCEDTRTVALVHHTHNHALIVMVVAVEAETQVSMAQRVDSQVGQHHLAHVALVTVHVQLLVAIHIYITHIAAVMAFPASRHTATAVGIKSFAVRQVLVILSREAIRQTEPLARRTDKTDRVHLASL